MGEWIEEFIDNSDAVWECGVPDVVSDYSPDFVTNECGDEDSDVAEEFVWIMRWWDPRTIDCYVDGTDAYWGASTICTDDEFDGVFFPGLLFDDRDAVFSQDDGEWEDALCYDEAETLVEDCLTDYLTIAAAFYSGLEEDELEELGLDATGLALLLTEYELAYYAEDYDLLAAAVCDGLTDAECAIDFSAFCDADVDTMFTSAGDTFGRAEIVDLVAFLMPSQTTQENYWLTVTSISFSPCAGVFWAIPPLLSLIPFQPSLILRCWMIHYLSMMQLVIQALSRALLLLLMLLALLWDLDFQVVQSAILPLEFWVKL